MNEKLESALALMVLVAFVAAIFAADGMAQAKAMTVAEQAQCDTACNTDTECEGC